MSDTPRPTPPAPPMPAALCNAGYNAVLELICQHGTQIAGLTAALNDLTARLRTAARAPLPPGPCSGQGGCACPPDAATDE